MRARCWHVVFFIQVEPDGRALPHNEAIVFEDWHLPGWVVLILERLCFVFPIHQIDNHLLERNPGFEQKLMHCPAGLRGGVVK
jgi:hypothetical protein